MEGATVVEEEVACSDAEAQRPPAAARSRIRSTRRARTLRWALAATLVVSAGALVATSAERRDAAQDRADAAAVEEAAAAEARGEVESREAATLETQAAADLLAASAAEAREEQRGRLRDLGLSEATVDAFLDRVRGNTDLVEWRRDDLTAEVDRQAREIPELEACMVAARQAMSLAFNRSIDGGVAVPTPTEMCLALLAP